MSVKWLSFRGREYRKIWSYKCWTWGIESPRNSSHRPKSEILSFKIYQLALSRRVGSAEYPYYETANCDSTVESDVNGDIESNPSDSDAWFSWSLANMIGRPCSIQPFSYNPLLHSWFRGWEISIRYMFTFNIIKEEFHKHRLQLGQQNKMGYRWLSYRAMGIPALSW
jgi:hypothetical protein